MPLSSKSGIAKPMVKDLSAKSQCGTKQTNEGY